MIVGVAFGLAMPWIALEFYGGSSADVISSVTGQSTGTNAMEMSSTITLLMTVLFWS